MIDTAAAPDPELLDEAFALGRCAKCGMTRLFIPREIACGRYLGEMECECGGGWAAVEAGAVRS